MNDMYLTLLAAFENMLSATSSQSPQACLSFTNKMIENIDKIKLNHEYLEKASSLDLNSMIYDLGSWPLIGSFSIKNPSGEVSLDQESNDRENEYIKNNKFPNANKEQESAVSIFYKFAKESIPSGEAVLISTLSGFRAGHILAALESPKDNNISSSIADSAIKNKGSSLRLMCMEALRNLPEEFILQGRSYSTKNIAAIEAVIPLRDLQRRGSSSIKTSLAKNDLSL